MTKSF